jgi:hypothetical protein
MFIYKKSLSPLISTILIVVVVVILITVVLSWTKVFTLSNLASANKVSEKSSLTNFVWQDNLLGTNLFIKNTNSNAGGTIVGYKINSFEDYSFLNRDLNLSSNVILAKNGFATIPLVCVPEAKFSVELITLSGSYITVPVTAKFFDVSSCTFITSITSPVDNYLTRSNNSISFASDISNSSGFETCQWSSDIDGVLSTDCDFNTSSLSVNTHVISLDVNDLGDVIEKTITVVVNPALNITINSPINNSGYLNGSEVEFTSTIDGNYSAYTCSWDSNLDNTLSSICDFNSSALSVGVHLLTLSITDSLGTESTTQNLTLKNNFTPSITSPIDDSNAVLNTSLSIKGTAINPFGSNTCSSDSNLDGSLGSG